MMPAKLVPKNQLWFHESAVQQRVAQAEAEFAAGRSVRTETPEEAQQFLDSLKGGEPQTFLSAEWSEQ